MGKRDMKHIILLCAILMILTSCSSLPPKGDPAPRLYTLNVVAAPQSKDIQSMPVGLKIVKPQVAPGLDTECIVLRQNDNQINYYADENMNSIASAFDKAQQNIMQKLVPDVLRELQGRDVVKLDVRK
jgi:ABC-type uncharacterized transport system auxiliary subunit